MAAPSYVAVKRKRDEAPIQSLILEERQTKHFRLNVEYRLDCVSQSSNQPPTQSARRQSIRNGHKGLLADTFVPGSGRAVNQQTTKTAGPRHFELTTGKRNAEAAGLLPTFVERPLKRAFTNAGPRSTTPQAPKPALQKRPGTKRTNIAAKNGTERVQDEARAEEEPSAALAASLHSFALQEAARDGQDEHVVEGEGVQGNTGWEETVHVKPRVIMQPKRPIRRRKEAVAQQEDPVITDGDDHDYVYDIYVRSTTQPSSASTQPQPPVPQPPSLQRPPAPKPSASPLLVPLEGDSTAPRSLLHSFPAVPDADFFSSLSLSHGGDGGADVGYLHLPAVDSEASSYFWTSDALQRRNPGGGDGASSSDDGGDGGDDEDSNAEDYYGADYPEDEVDGDDEMGVGEWRFRRGSEGEDDFADAGWAGRGTFVGKDGAERMWSDDEDDEEVDEHGGGGGRYGLGRSKWG